MRRIHVMAAVIRDAQGRILIAKRPDDVHQGGLWEFPGGKLESDETRFDGLVRELREELGIAVTEARPLLDIRHDYPDKSVRLDVWLVTGFDGQVHGAEGQPVRWVSSSELDDYDFPVANAPIVRAAQLPELYLITPDMNDEAALFAGLERARDTGVRMVQLRQTGLSAKAYRAMSGRVLARFGNDFQWLLKGDEPPIWAGAGWHLTSRQLRERAALLCDAKSAGRPESGLPQQPLLPHPSSGNSALAAMAEAADRRIARGDGLADGQPLVHRPLLAASCHSAEELAMAAAIGVDFLTLSPLMLTASHPGASPLGWERAQELIETINLPVYLLGGIGPGELEKAFEAGAQGVAGIRQLWV